MIVGGIKNDLIQLGEPQEAGNKLWIGSPYQRLCAKPLSRAEAICGPNHVFVVHRLAGEQRQFLRGVVKGRVEYSLPVALAMPFDCLTLAVRYAFFWHQQGAEDVYIGTMLSELNLAATRNPHQPYTKKSKSLAARVAIAGSVRWGR